jgi:hypothetical protein
MRLHRYILISLLAIIASLLLASAAQADPSASTETATDAAQTTSTESTSTETSTTPDSKECITDCEPVCEKDCVPTCETHPELPECQPEEPDCTENCTPTTPDCVGPSCVPTTPDAPGGGGSDDRPLPFTGPGDVLLAVIIALLAGTGGLLLMLGASSRESLDELSRRSMASPSGFKVAWRELVRRDPEG